MMEAAAVAADGAIGLVGVTVLTSHDAASYARALGRREVDLADEVVRQSGEAVRSGRAGVVCSPHEVARVRRCVGEHALDRGSGDPRPRRRPRRPGPGGHGGGRCRRRRDPSGGGAARTPGGRSGRGVSWDCWRRRSASAPDRPAARASGRDAGAGAGAADGLDAAAERARSAWLAHDAVGARGRQPTTPGPASRRRSSAALGPDQAAALLADFLASAQEVETVVRAAREVEPGRGYVELQRRYRVVRHPGGPDPEPAAGLPVGADRAGGLVELRVVS